ncbi:hypothetical protein [Sphingopyxis sp. H050]|uniref:hypothetical protein n=1 Tax=Sphingopyxis sp. H050 TaxID=1759072 RepID=UPI000A778DC9|nr:hypothetical protein [Sphingopyxis sp. H050]
MGGAIEKLDKWSGRIANAAALLPIIPASVAGLIVGYLSTGVAWISQFGAFGWFSAGLAGFLATSTALALLAKTRLWRVEAKIRERITGDGSPFDPMARVYENKRLYLRDLAPQGRREVIGKTFINCELIGPGTAIIGLRSSEQKPWPKMENSNTFDVDCIEIDVNVRSALAISFLDCDFSGCNFYHLTLLFGRRENQTLHWITPNFNEPRLLTDENPADAD